MSIGFIVALVSALIAAAIALLMSFVARRSAAHWFFSAGLIALAAESMCVGLAADSALPEQAVVWIRWSMLAQACIPFPWLAFSMTYARGNPKQQLLQNRVALGLALVLPVVLALFFGDRLLSAISQTGRDGSWALRLALPGAVFNAVFLVMAVMVILNLERTFRASVGTMRWRIKFMVIGLGILFIVRAYTSSQTLLFRGADLSYGVINNTALALGCLILIRSLFRAGNFEVSVYPSQSVLANSFTVLLAGIYLVLVGVLAKVLSWLGGDTAFEIKAFVVLIALVLLATLLLSDRVRLWTKQFVSRHFQRPVYDYRGIWDMVTRATARCVDQAELCSTVSRLASEIFQSLSVTIWLIDERRENFALTASTSVSAAGAQKIALPSEEARNLAVALAAHPEPIDIDGTNEPWAAALRQIHPDQFRKGGNRICVPIIAGGELLGMLNMGDRVGGMQFCMQDLDLLKSIAGHVAAGLLNIQLSQRLSQAKQLEAFQAMSAFFVHDLKNTASTLSLMLRNFPLHYQDAAFREDALRGISRTVEHINDIIARLNTLRQELSIQAVECDLNELVAEILKGQEQTSGIELVKALNPLPKILIDPGQVGKVLTNLLLNSRDALADGGRIQIETSSRNGWAVLSVTDDGCGMTREFMQKNLFRPFQTTKKRGIGIGMFHCKMIVEAHNGRIEVDSEPGKGTSFRVLLPLAAT